MTLLAAAALAACGGTSTAAGGDTNACSIALSGAATASITCTNAVAGYSSANGEGLASLTTSGQNPVTNISFAGAPHTGIYHSTDTGAGGGITYTSGTSSWLTGPGIGTFTLNLTTVNIISTSGTSTAYAIHGTLDATMPAVSGSTLTGSVTLHASF